jgi:integrase
MSDHLIQRKRQWYLKLAIPRPLRQHFPSKSGNPRDFIWESLGRDYDRARPEAAQRVADYEKLFARLRSGLPLTPEAVEAELAAIKQRGEARHAVNLPMLESEIERLVARTREDSDARIVESIKQSPFNRPDLFSGLAKRLGVPYSEEIGNKLGDMLLHAMYPREQAETISQAAEAWYVELQREDVRAGTLDGHKLRVRTFVKDCGDLPLASVTKAMAKDWLAALAKGRSNGTVNSYAVSMMLLFDSACERERFKGENPFKAKRLKAKRQKRSAFTSEELAKLFAALPVEIAPAKHTPDTALPWVARIAAYTGMRLEEIAQLTVADVQTRGSNGGTVIVFDIHNGDSAHHLKNESSARAIPMHSELVRAGLLDYIGALPDKGGLLFPGLKRRTSKGGKIGARLGELFRKRLIALGMKSDGLCFHSLRHTVAQRLEAAAVSQTDAARVTGHAIEGMTYGVYSTGPGLKRLAAVVEEIRYSE